MKKAKRPEANRDGADLSLTAQQQPVLESLVSIKQWGESDNATVRLGDLRALGEAAHAEFRACAEFFS